MLERLGYSTTKALEGPLEPPTRIGWETIPSHRTARDRPASSAELVGRSCRSRASPCWSRAARGASARTIALRFAELGALARRDRLPAQRRRGERDGRRARSGWAPSRCLLRGNVGDPERVRELLEEAGPLDVVVANAATGVIRPALELEEKHWDWTLNANARSLFTLARLAAPTMPRGSSIVAISSLGSQRVLDDYVVVGVSKAAIEALVRYLAVELAPLEIRVNAVSAGLIETGALAYFAKRDEMLAFFRSRTPGRAPRRAPAHGRRRLLPRLAAGRDDPGPDARRRRRLRGPRLTSDEAAMPGRARDDESRYSFVT